VDERLLRQGIATALLDELFERADRPGTQYTLEVRLSNESAIALYERFGFRREGYLRRHYRRRSGELWDAVVMGLPLD
jgi:ribosomal protein S18 acetylase RimI-like enzyme